MIDYDITFLKGILQKQIEQQYTGYVFNLRVVKCIK